MILAFGIMGLLGSMSMICCAPFGLLGLFSPIAWVMGRGDLQQIDDGVMNPRGRGTTQTGMVLGIVGTVFLGIGTFLFLAWLAMAFAQGI